MTFVLNIFDCLKSGMAAQQGNKIMVNTSACSKKEEVSYEIIKT